MKGFGIEVKNDLLDPKHHKNMGEAIWLYLWLLDKITSVSETGLGKILGGKPVTIEEIQKELFLPERTYSRYLVKLKKHGYIITTRTPYGLVFYVTKAHKRFSNRYAKSGTSEHRDTPKVVERYAKSVGRDTPQTQDVIKTVTIDSNKDTTVADATRFSFKEEIGKLASNKRKDFKIIALYWATKKWEFENREQFNSALKRELRPAGSLKGYSGEQIAKAITHCRENYKEWSLETVGKRITDIINKK